MTILVTVTIVGLPAACDSVDPEVVGPRATSGVARTSSDSFGLLIFPCGTQQIATVELGILRADTHEFEPILRETFDPPADPHSLLVSTQADKVSPGATREVLNGPVLQRVNEDHAYLTTPWPPLPDSALVVRAFEAGSNVDVSGSADIALNQRFSLDVGQVNVDGRVGQIDEFRCFTSGHPKAWSSEVGSGGDAG